MNDEFDYLAAESAIYQCITEALPFVAVEVALTADGIVSKGRTKPTVIVLFDGDKVVDELATGDSIVEQRWAVFLVMRGPKASRDSGNIASGIESDGVVLHKLLTALAGFEPGEDFTPLVRSSGMKSDYIDGARLYGVSFSTNVVIPA